MTAENYLNKDGKIKVWPGKQEAKLAVVRHMGNQFDSGRFYTEKEVNRIIDDNHTFQDYFLLRREMIDRRVMHRVPDGAQYWRGGLWGETSGTETKRLTIRPAEPADQIDLSTVFFACGYMAEWTGQQHDEAALVSLLANDDLPPGGHAEFSHLAAIRSKESGEVVGLTQYYTAWPSENQLWIGLLLLHPDCQKQGYGSELIETYIAEGRRQAYQQIGLGVALRNQPALKFWVKSGFDRIGKVTADGEAGEGSLAMMRLFMTL